MLKSACSGKSLIKYNRDFQKQEIMQMLESDCSDKSLIEYNRNF